MTLLEFITDLQSQGFTDKEVFDKAQEFKKNNAAKEEVEETEVVEVGNDTDTDPPAESKYRYKGKTYTVILFPADTLHGVDRQTKEYERITFAFNIEYKDPVFAEDEQLLQKLIKGEYNG